MFGAVHAKYASVPIPGSHPSLARSLFIPPGRLWSGHTEWYAGDQSEVSENATPSIKRAELSVPPVTWLQKFTAARVSPLPFRVGLARVTGKEKNPRNSFRFKIIERHSRQYIIQLSRT